MPAIEKRDVTANAISPKGRPGRIRRFVVSSAATRPALLVVGGKVRILSAQPKGQARQRVKLVVVMPVGPTEALDHVRDTIESIAHYTTPSRRIVLIDDSGSGLGRELQGACPDTDVVETKGHSGTRGGLYLGLCRGYAHACREYDFDVILRMDVDSLVIGSEPEADAIACFRSKPDLGIIGSYTVDCNGGPRDASGAANRLQKETSWRWMLRHPRCLRGGLLLQRALRKALRNGYDMGEACMGGAVFVSRECVSALCEAGLCPANELGRSGLSEDFIFGLLIYSVGFKHGDFATGLLPMGLRWRGLPCSPQELLDRGKKVAHSTRFFKDMTEDDIRTFFRRKRGSTQRSNGG